MLDLIEIRLVHNEMLFVRQRDDVSCNYVAYTDTTQLLPDVGYSQVKMSKTSNITGSPVEIVGVETGLTLIPSPVWM